MINPRTAIVAALGSMDDGLDCPDAVIMHSNNYAILFIMY